MENEFDGVDHDQRQNDLIESQSEAAAESATNAESQDGSEEDSHQD